MSDTSWIIPGKEVWIKSQGIFKNAVISQRDQIKKIAKCKLTATSSITVTFTQIYQCSLNKVIFSDMCNMDILNEPQILFNLRRRYSNNVIFTKIGPTLIVINPYKKIPQLFSQNILNQLTIKIKSNPQKLDGIEPHVYLFAGIAYNQMKLQGKKQAIIISGESGAGKTENAKYCMKFLANLSHDHLKQTQDQSTIQKKILDCNPVLQAFGNAKTVRNSNSSRFGKYVKLLIDQSHKIVGAKIQNYLLEKSRVTTLSKSERNFHVFYSLISSEAKKKFGLIQGQKYDILQQSQCYNAEGIDDKEDFTIVNQSLLEIGFSKEQIYTIWRIISTILMIGNLKFDGRANKQNMNNPCTFLDQNLANRIAKNLGISIKDLQSVLLIQKKISGKQSFIIKFNETQCISNRNTLSKALYNRVFQFLIEKMNIRLDDEKGSSINSIGLLDIFGFQKFDVNSFEQLCINFTNEKLQKLYTKYVFDTQIEEIKKDGLGDKVSGIIPPDNKSIIDLIEKKNGVMSIFGIIDDKTSLGSANDQAIVNQLRKLKNPNLIFNPNASFKLLFSITHTQSTVTYTVDGFKFKNQDSVTPQITQVLNSLLILNEQQDLADKKVGKTLVSKFDKQIRSLIQQLQNSDIHFIRCIKPNDQRKPDFINEQYTLQQIKYLGILETIKIRKSTFPFRKAFSQFNQICMAIVPPNPKLKNLKPKQVAEFLIKKLFPKLQQQKNSYLLGNQRIYLNHQTQCKLNEVILVQFKLRQEKAKKIQKQVKIFLLRKNIFKNLKKILYIKKLNTLYNKTIKKKKFNQYRTQIKKQIEYRKEIDQFSQYIYQKTLIKIINECAKQQFIDISNEINKQKEAKRYQQLKEIDQNKFKSIKLENQKKAKQIKQQDQKRAKQAKQQRQQKYKELLLIKQQQQKKKLESLREASKKMVTIAQKKNLTPKQQKFEILFEKKIINIINRYRKFASFFKIKFYQNDLDKTIVDDATEYQSEYYSKNPRNPQYIQENKFNQSFYDDKSMAQTHRIGVTLKGELKIQKFTRHIGVKKITEIIDEIYQGNAMQDDEFYSPMSKDCNFEIKNVKPDILHKIINFAYIEFFKGQLRRRNTLFGLKKSVIETLTAKRSLISKSLLKLTQIQEKKAIQSFRILLKISQQEKFDKVFRLIEELVEIITSSSQKLKNQVFTQIIKQQRLNTDLATIRMYQVLTIFLHIFNPEQGFLYAALNIFYQRLSLTQNRRQTDYIKYLFPRILHQIQKGDSILNAIIYMPAQYQLMALMCRRQISVPIFFSMGNSIIIRVQSHQTFEEIKEEVLKQAGLNYKRLRKDYFGFFEIMNFQNQQLQQSPIDDHKSVWDTLTYWQKAKEKFEQGNINPPIFILMLKIKHVYECETNDDQSIQLFYAQCYFDLFIGRIRLQKNEIIMVSALLRLLNDDKKEIDPLTLIPMWATQEFGIQNLLGQIQAKYLKLKQQNNSPNILKFLMIKNCDNNKLCMSMAIPTEQPVKLFLKPKRIMLAQKSIVLEQIPIKRILKWSVDGETLMISVQKQKSHSSKTIVIRTQHGNIVSKYLSQSAKLIMETARHKKSIAG